jgi:hypothetical protein
MTITTQAPAYLPPELWIKVLRNLNEENDLTELWFHRHVCTTFRDAVEFIFIEKHLPKTTIRWNLGKLPSSLSSSSYLLLTIPQGHTYSEELGKITLDSEFEYESLSEDKKTATFRAPIADLYQKVIFAAFEERMNDIENPPYTIQIHRDLNDSPIPNIRIKAEKNRLRLDWKGMYTCFYGEELRYHKGLTIWTEKAKQDLKAQSAGMDMVETMRLAIEAFAGASEESRKAARRARVLKMFRDKGEVGDGEWVWDEDMEKEVLERLNEARQVASMEEDSDFDEEESDDSEEDEDEEEGDEEEDEWEDASDDGEEDVEEEA